MTGIAGLMKEIDRKIMNYNFIEKMQENIDELKSLEEGSKTNKK